MKKHFALILFILFLAPLAAFAQVRVRGHYNRRMGTYVAPHYRSSPDHSRLNNWSTKGNTNPFTGKRGSGDPLRTYRRGK